MNPQRRRFLCTSMAVGAIPLVGCSSQLRELSLMQLPTALSEMHRLGQAAELQSSTQWSWPKTLEHLAQSIEYSMTGYPTQKSTLFQTALGKPAFNVFSWRGSMHHDLTEPIPGSPELAEYPPLEQAVQRLLTACQQFMQWTGPLQPHFAYGALSHAEYEQAHAMHLANHFAAFHTG